MHEVGKLVETPRRSNCESKSKYVKWFMLGRVCLFGILFSGKTMTEEVRELVESLRERNCEKK